MLEMKETEIDGMRFQLWPLNAKDQFHVFRRIAPLITGLGEGLNAVTAEVGEEGMTEAQMVRMMAPLFKVLSEMPDSECDYIIDKCMGRIRLFSGSTWVPLTVSGRMQFEDRIDMSVMMRLTVEMLQHTGVLNFLSESPAPNSSNGASLAPQPLSN